MTAVEQIYTTHCTREQAAINDSDGFTVRAGSLKGAKLEECYHLVQRWTGYKVPRDLAQLSPDVPPEFYHDPEVNADTMPIRLVYRPASRILGHVCYRESDSTGTRGSTYFGHFLVGAKGAKTAEDGGVWKATDCLKYWEWDQWVRRESPDIRQQLPSFPLFQAPERPVVNDDVVHSFLTAPAGGPFDDPGWLITDGAQGCRRWPPEKRQAMLRDIVRGFLELDLDQRQCLALVADPEFAALLFYGALRLLPETALPWEKITFSTYEADLKSLSTLTATTFSSSPFWTRRRRAIRPMRPKPLIA